MRNTIDCNSVKVSPSLTPVASKRRAGRDSVSRKATATSSYHSPSPDEAAKRRASRWVRSISRRHYASERTIRIMSRIFVGLRGNAQGCAPHALLRRRRRAYFRSLRIRSCINKEYPRPTTVSIAISSCLQLHRHQQPPFRLSLGPLRRLKLSPSLSLSLAGSREFPPSGCLPPLLETMRLPIAFAIPRFHRASRAHILLLTSPPSSLSDHSFPTSLAQPPALSSRKRFARESFYIFIKQLNSLPDEAAHSALARGTARSERNETRKLERNEEESPAAWRI